MRHNFSDCVTCVRCHGQDLVKATCDYPYFHYPDPAPTSWAVKLGCAPRAQPMSNATATGCADIVPGAVLRGAAARIFRGGDVALLSDWARLAAEHGATEVPVRVLDGASSIPPYRGAFMPLAEALNRTVRAPAADPGRRAISIEQLNVFNVVPDIARAAGIPADGPRELCRHLPPAEHTTFFAGAGGISVTMHMDRDHTWQGTNIMRGKANLFVQLSGAKRFVLFPPSVPIAAMYPYGDALHPHISRAHAAACTAKGAADLAGEWPLLAEQWENRVEIQLGAGDGLLIPSWWWHCTASVEDGSAVNWWFDEGI